MSFASPVFLWYFVPAVLAAYWLSPPRRRNAVLTASSLVFYAWGAGAFVVLLLAVIAVSFAAGRLLEREAPGGKRQRAVLAIAIVLNVAPLIIWKYAGFLVERGNELFRWVGFRGFVVPELLLPIGISFFTFQCLSYVIDVARGTQGALRRLVDFATYISMFPQLVAGPIVRYSEIADQLQAPPPRSARLDNFAAGFRRFSWGLAKKVLIADSVGVLVDVGFADAHPTFALAWLSTLAFAVQIYFDFSGYSDMAIGLGRMLGFSIPENFARPYSATSVTDFWRRWHISLSRWFRDYVYVPLGGNRGPRARTYANLTIVFLLTGIWHGAELTFLAWGAYHGAWLVFERATGLAARRDAAVGRPGALAGRLGTFAVVCLGWVVFRAPSIEHGLEMLASMLDPTTGFALGPDLAAVLTSQRKWALGVGLATLALPPTFVFGPWLDTSRDRAAQILGSVSATVGATYSAAVVAAGTFSPFLYFQF